MKNIIHLPALAIRNYPQLNDACVISISRSQRYNFVFRPLEIYNSGVHTLAGLQSETVND